MPPRNVVTGFSNYNPTNVGRATSGFGHHSVSDMKDPSGLFGGFSDNPCDLFGPEVILDGMELSRDFFCVELIAAPVIFEPKATCADYIAPFASLLTEDELAIAEAVFAESSGNDQEGVAIAFVIKNRHWFLNVPGLSSTLGIGPRGASVRQVLGAPGQFPEYDSTGQLKGDAKRRLEQTLAGDPSTPDCQLLYKAHVTVYAIGLGGIGDPFADQGGSWAFQLGRSSPCPICQYLGKLGKTNFWAIPYTNYTGGARPPWL